MAVDDPARFRSAFGGDRGAAELHRSNDEHVERAFDDRGAQPVVHERVRAIRDRAPGALGLRVMPEFFLRVQEVF